MKLARNIHMDRFFGLKLYPINMNTFDELGQQTQKSTTNYSITVCLETLKNNPMNNLTALDLLAANAGPAPEWFKPTLSKETLEEIRKRQEVVGKEIGWNLSVSPIERTDIGCGIREKIENRERQLQWPYYYAKSVLAYRPITIPDNTGKLTTQ
jgi:hypothetical protein